VTSAPTFLKNLWDDREAAKRPSPLDLLRYRSNRLGDDLRITNFGGGNTSSKFELPDPFTGKPARVMAVKGSGGDLRSIGVGGFAVLYLDKLETLLDRYRGEAHEDEMVGFYPLCAFGENRVAASIDTALHAFLPFPHVDHLHPDWAIALAASANGAAKLDEFNRKYGRNIAWVPWQRPGFELALMLKRAVESRPGCDGIILGGHGLFTWGTTQRECYVNSITTIDQMGEFIEAHARRANRPAFGGPAVTGVVADRDAAVAELFPALRGAVSSNRRVIGHYDGSEDALTFANSAWAADLCGLGTSCPDHFLRTRISPMFVPWNPASEDVATIRERIAERIATYRDDYAAYYKAFADGASPALRDSNPSVVVIPGLGLFGFGRDKREARITTEFFVNAIHVMRGANALEDKESESAAPALSKGEGPVPQVRRQEQAKEFKVFHNYVALPRLEAFRIEYWALEEAKLQRMPPEKEFSRKVVVVVGGASGIGREVALQIAKRGGHVVVADQNATAAAEAAQEAAKLSSGEMVQSAALDLTRRDTIEAAVRAAVRFRRQHGGDLPDAGSVAAGRSRVGKDAAHQRDVEFRAGPGDRAGAEGAEPARVDGADQFRERGRAEGGERGVRRQQGGHQPPGARAGHRPRPARPRERHRAGHRYRRLVDVPPRPRHRRAQEIRHPLRRAGIVGRPARQAGRVLRAADHHAPADPADRQCERDLLPGRRAEREDDGPHHPRGRWTARSVPQIGHRSTQLTRHRQTQINTDKERSLPCWSVFVCGGYGRVCPCWSVAVRRRSRRPASADRSDRCDRRSRGSRAGA
jgi:rhamnose utilization protein RhaD (predicted bifunctional aldolase and dehydrogenase)